MERLMRAFITFACFLLGGCAVGPGSGHALTGTSWRFVAIDGDQPVSSDARLEFKADRLGANVGCNGMGGNWRVENGRLIAGPLTQTEMYCEGHVWDQEQALGALLAAAPAVERRQDRLVLKSSGHSAELVRIAGQP